MLGDSTLDDLIAKLAVEEGLVLPSDMARARETQKVTARPIEDILRAEGLLDADQVERIRRQAGPVTPAPLSDQVREAMLDPKRRIGKYVLLDELGRGGMGIVRRAWDSSLERHVAVKCLPASANAEDLARFRREAQTAAKLNHPNIIPVHEILEHGDALYVVMELIDGKRLDQAGLDARGAAAALRDAANAIQYAHEKGIVHRDLKPANLMVDTARRVWVMDFGIARPVSSGTTLTATGIIQGTPSYMSPEHATASPFTPLADVYSLGATLYDLLTGELPFKGENALEVLRQIVHDDPVPVRERKPSVPVDLETIAMKCLEKKPERRYRSAAELAQDLDRWLKGEPILAHPPSTFYRISKFVQRRRAAVAAVLLLLSVAGFAVVSTVRGARALQRTLGAARVEEGNGDLKAARDGYRRVLDLDPGNAEAGAAFARVDAALRGAEERLKAEADAAKARFKAREQASALAETARAGLERAARMRREPGNYSKVIEAVAPAQDLLAKALALAPDLAVGHHLSGVAWSLRGEDGEAEKAWRKAVELDATFAAPHLELGRLHIFGILDASLDITPEESLRPGRTEKEDLLVAAAREMELYVRLAGNSGPPELLELARMMQALAKKDVAAARALVAAAMNLHGDAEGMEEFLFVDALFLSKGEAASRALNRALELRPNYFEALFLRGADRVDQGRINEAIADFSKAIEIRPKYAPVWMQRALAWRKVDEYDRALSDIDAAALRAPRDPFIQLNRAVVQLDLNDPEKAEAILGALILKEPSWAPAFELRGTARAMRRDLEGAFEDYSRAIGLHATSRCYMNRGQTQADLGRRDAAIRDLEMGASLAPEGSPYRAECLRRIAQLKERNF